MDYALTRTSAKDFPKYDDEEALKDIYRRLRPGDPPTAAELTYQI